MLLQKQVQAVKSYQKREDYGYNNKNQRNNKKDKVYKMNYDFEI